MTKNADNSDRPKPEGHSDLSKNWVGAGALKPGDEVKHAEAKAGTVKFVYTTLQFREMYNLSVDEGHTYSVGQDKALVHNANAVSKAFNVTCDFLQKHYDTIVGAGDGMLEFTTAGVWNGPAVRTTLDKWLYSNIPVGEKPKYEPVNYSGNAYKTVKSTTFGTLGFASMFTGVGGVALCKNVVGFSALSSYTSVGYNAMANGDNFNGCMGAGSLGNGALVGGAGKVVFGPKAPDYAPPVFGLAATLTGDRYESVLSGSCK